MANLDRKAYYKEYEKERSIKPERKAYMKIYLKEYSKKNERTPERIAYQKAYDAKSEVKAKKKAYQIKPETRIKYRGFRLKNRHGITLKQYQEMFDKQNGCCPICGKYESDLKKRLVVDHDHKTLKIRGLLCDTCNKGIGLFYDNVEFLTNAINYLKMEL